MSGVMMLNHLHEEKIGEKIKKAYNTVLAEGKTLTRDLGGSAGTNDGAEAAFGLAESATGLRHRLDLHQDCSEAGSSPRRPSSCSPRDQDTVIKNLIVGSTAFAARRSWLPAAPASAGVARPSE